MAAIIHPLLSLLASLSRQELAQQVTYLKTENKILRSKLPDRIQLNNQERRRLVKHGLKLGARIKDLISVAAIPNATIVHQCATKLNQKSSTWPRAKSSAWKNWVGN